MESTYWLIWFQIIVKHQCTKGNPCCCEICVFYRKIEIGTTELNGMQVSLAQGSRSWPSHFIKLKLWDHIQSLLHKRDWFKISTNSNVFTIIILFSHFKIRSLLSDLVLQVHYDIHFKVKILLFLYSITWFLLESSNVSGSIH